MYFSWRYVNSFDTQLISSCIDSTLVTINVVNNEFTSIMLWKYDNTSRRQHAKCLLEYVATWQWNNLIQEINIWYKCLWVYCKKYSILWAMLRGIRLNLLPYDTLFFQHNMILWAMLRGIRLNSLPYDKLFFQHNRILWAMLQGLELHSLPYDKLFF